MYIKTLSVTAVNNYIKKTMDNDFILSNLTIEGELSNFKAHSSGHLYFSLKDEKSKINCIMFRSYAQNLNFIPGNGKKVVIKGKVSVYEKEGTYQLYCYEMAEQGVGELFIAFNELKNKLEKQGLFDVSHKRQIPKYPKRIGVITSPTGAAIRDIINVATRRNSLVDLLIYPALVQGENASEDIINGIKVLNNVESVDVIILARGGGSIEELWAFNSENLAYAVYNSKKPVITGVGHETDFTIVDFVSDRRAPTPSAAAEIAVYSLDELKSKIGNYKKIIDSSIKDIISEKYNKVEVLNKSLKLYSPINYIINQYNYIEKLQDKLNFIINSKISTKQEQISKAYALINANNPLKVLNRGYSVIEDLNGSVISSKKILMKNKNIKIIMKDGKIKACLENVEEFD